VLAGAGVTVDYLPGHLFIPPATWRLDPTGESALAALDRLLDQAGPDTVAAFFCEPISAAALPGYTPPEAFWHGLAERRERHGFLICFDEVVTGMGRTGSWFAAQQLPIEPDIITGGKGLGAGYAPLAATLCREHVYEALAAGSRNFEHGHTWDGAPLPCGVGLAVLEALEKGGLVESVRRRGPGLLTRLEQALSGSDIVREVRGRGFLPGVALVVPRDGESVLSAELAAADHRGPPGVLSRLGEELDVAPLLAQLGVAMARVLGRRLGRFHAESVQEERLAVFAARLHFLKFFVGGRADRVRRGRNVRMSRESEALFRLEFVHS